LDPHELILRDHPAFREDGPTESITYQRLQFLKEVLNQNELGVTCAHGADHGGQSRRGRLHEIVG